MKLSVINSSRKIFTILILLLIVISKGHTQDTKSVINSITENELKSHITFLSSPELEGRSTGERGMEIATNYLEAQAIRMGLKPVNGDSYLQPYTLITSSIDYTESGIHVTSGNNTEIINNPLYQIVPFGANDVDIEGEIVFAGYGITSQKYNYNDFEDIDVEGKIILIMNRAPMNEDGSECQFEEEGWTTMMNFNLKYMNLMYKKPKAILIVMDPKSGHKSLDEDSPGISSYLSKRLSMKGSPDPSISAPGMVNLFIIHRVVADAILSGSGHSLKELQDSIDKDLKPLSFPIEDKMLRVKTVVKSEEVIVNNVAGLVEGSDPLLKEEVIIYSAHMDHIGMSSDGLVNFGADDDATGCAALVEIAEAFQSLEKKPARSILFLWVSAEEVGLFGSQFYTNNPLIPLEKTLADINIDMIGRTMSESDTSENTPVTGPESVFLIGGHQSSDLKKIAQSSASKLNLSINLDLNDMSHPLNLFSRSDHYNFVQKDIPVLFFTTGLHSDYHTERDVVGKLDFPKLTLITRTLFDIGFTVANNNERIINDNPFSSWNR